MGYLDSTLRGSIAREDVAPLLNANFETSVPGLYIVGIASAPTFGPVMRFMFGAKHAASALAHHPKQKGTVQRTQPVGSLSRAAK